MIPLVSQGAKAEKSAANMNHRPGQDHQEFGRFTGRKSRHLEHRQDSRGRRQVGVEAGAPRWPALGVGVALKGALKSFSDFEKRLIGIGKTTGIAGAQLAGLGADIQAMARNLPVATNQLLDIGQSAGQLGVKGRDNILKFVETVGRIGLATDLAGDVAATAFARILTVTGQPQSNVDRLGAALVQLGNNFAATESEIAHVATRVGQATSQFDLNTAAVLGISTALKALGVRAELGGSVVGRAFLKMNEAIRGGGEAMTTLQTISGLTASQLERDFKERPEVVFRAFIEGLGRIKDSGGGRVGSTRKNGSIRQRKYRDLGNLGEPVGRAHRRTRSVRPSLGRKHSTHQRIRASGHVVLVGNAKVWQPYQRSWRGPWPRVGSSNPRPIGSIRHPWPHS